MLRHSRIEPKGRHLWAKRMLATVRLHPVSGRMIATVFRHRIPHRGARIQVPHSVDPRVCAALFWGTYESAEIRYVRQFLEGDLDTVELGSSLGGVSCEVARKLQPGRRLVCVEANADLLPLLRDNVRANAPGSQVKVLHGAIDYGGSGSVQFAIGDSSLSSRVGAGRVVRDVPAFTLAQVLRQEGVAEYALVCDIEGAEAASFSQDRHALDECRMLIIELHEVVSEGVRHTPDTLISMIETNTPLRLLARYGEVCTFSRPAAPPASASQS